MRIATTVTELLGIDLPILAGGTAQEALAVSQAGGLGVIDAGSMDRDDFAAAVEQVQAGTGRPFAACLPLKGARDRLALVQARGVGVVVTVDGRPDEGCARPAAAWFHTVTSLDDALAATAADGLIVGQGEAGAAAVPFQLLRDIACALPGMPLVALGGRDGADLAAALAVGAGAVWFSANGAGHEGLVGRVAAEYDAAVRQTRLPARAAPARAADRTTREANALRENLRKRKEQARARSET